MMQSITTWVLSIAGAAALGIFVDLLVPEGKTRKYVRGVFGIVVVLVVILPLPGLLKKDYTLDMAPDDPGAAVSLDSAYLTDYYLQQIKKTEAGVEKYLSVSGYPDTAVTLITNGFNADMIVTNAYVDASETPTPSGKTRDGAYADIKSLAAWYLSIDQSNIIVYG